jgi:hypothetical protein
VSRVRKPLAPVRAVAGSYFSLSVVGPAAPLRATVNTRRLIGGQSRFGTACQVGEEEHAGRAGVASLLFVESWPWSDAPKVLRECLRRISILNLPNFFLVALVLHSSFTGLRPLSSSSVVTHLGPSGHPLLPLSRSCSGVSRVRMPLAPVRGVAGSYFSLSVVGPAAPLRATVSTRRLIGGQS